MDKPNFYSETWDGGYVRLNAKGRKVYVIRRMINGRLYKVSTRVHTATAAHEQLKRFEADPEGYRPGGVPQREGLYLGEEFASKFLTWCRDVQKNSREWLE